MNSPVWAWNKNVSTIAQKYYFYYLGHLGHSLRKYCGKHCIYPVQHVFSFYYNLALNMCFFAMSPALSYRLVSRCLCSCSKECSGYTTVTGSTLFRRPQWRLVLKYSQTWVRYWTNTNTSLCYCIRKGVVAHVKKH